MATILVVDDGELNRNVITTLLGYTGHHLLEASSGPEGLSKVQAENPELVITDILMPDMDGYEFVKTLRTLSLEHQPQVIFYSATYLEGEALALARACGVSHVICKPAEPETLLKVVSEALASHTVESSPAPEAANLEGEAVKVLSNKLYLKVKELEELNGELERRVAERTWDLEKANHSLELQIIERQKAETEAAKINEARLKMKSDFLSHVSHELRSPLGVIHQFTTILLDELGGPLNSDQREYLEISLRNLNQLKCLIDDLLEASRADVGKLAVRCSSISIQEAIEQSAKSHEAVAAKGNVALKTEVEELPAVYADPARVSQILTNLLDNALKFSPAGTTVIIQAKRYESDPSFVCVSVADCGCGIKRDEAERIFDRLYQVKDSLNDSRRGLGLGLYISKQLVDLQGGSIWVETKPAAGSTFCFTLPTFTIENMIAPLLERTAPVTSSVALLAVTVSPSGGWQNEIHRERSLHKVEQHLERCLLPDLDVMLPPQNCSGYELFGIVARTDERGARVMISRIRDQLSHFDGAQNGLVHCSVDSEVLDLASLEDLSAQSLVSRVATHLQDLLRKTKDVRGADEQNTSSRR